MKIKKLDKRLLSLTFIITFIFVNFNFIYKPLQDKEKRLINQKKVIKILETDKVKNEQLIIDKQSLIIDVENYFKDICLVKYIKARDIEKDFVDIEMCLNGDRSLLVERLVNIEKLSEKIFLEDMNISKVDENNIECSFKLKIY
ncbi:MAG: hypothetical protein ACRDDM_08130 [Paraclostridium sp.]